MSFPDWLKAELVPILAPLRNLPNQRHPMALLQCAAQFQVNAAPRYQPRDLTGDGRLETFCNFFLTDVTTALGCKVLQMRANYQMRWLTGEEGRANGWCVVTRELAAVLACVGRPVVAGWRNPDDNAPGHVALLMPPVSPYPTAENCLQLVNGALFSAQAGRRNWSHGLLESGFGQVPITFVAHA